MTFDVAVIGAGIAGASLAAELAAQANVLILEAESQPGFHATGRSAAFWSESYGGPAVQPLTRASRAALARPAPDFADRPFLHPRGAIHLADRDGEAAIDRLSAQFGAMVELRAMDRAALEAAIPGLRRGWEHGLFEPSCADIDVTALHQAYLSRARRRGAQLVTDARMLAAERTGSGWSIRTSAGSFEAGVLANAAGAWADQVAVSAGETPLGIRPYRRTLAQLRVAPPAPAALPLVIDARERFYFKPEAGGRLWLSPHDETHCPAGDCAPEELDVAVGIDRLGEVVDWRVEAVERKWAGLRSFAPDRRPVYGYAEGRPDYFWFAGQGGFGIQTAPAAAQLAASLLLGAPLPDSIEGVDPELYAPGRFTN